MNSKEILFNNSLASLKEIIQEIPRQEAQNIYVLSFYCYVRQDYYPTIEISYNTLEKLTQEISNTSNKIGAKWNYTFWLQDSIGKIGGKADLALQNWFKELPYFYTKEQLELASENDKALYAKLLRQLDDYEDEFVGIIIACIRELFKEGIIAEKFGRDIPVILHDGAYYYRPIRWIKKANDPKLIKEFISAYEKNFLND